MASQDAQEDSETSHHSLTEQQRSCDEWQNADNPVPTLLPSSIVLRASQLS